ncbi:MAG: hypothetical protein H6916_15000 [Novosphingobium sp.]|jgi:hypothetical protein|uniref:Uncharacterized protein n=1 Tax=Novosphingobium hassiacum TaxID=173676 RepID=A0A7W6EY20_9SPHN|nr:MULTISPECIES: hypothetical protein [Sphingomonadaceae]MCI1755339.1 hypothetical protein [Sphingobium sp.]MCP5307215.1 hypothetical protein [Chromatiaceae bacterium]MBB3862715.1 hypothetical protein [Novosphingobium hassiacum]MCP5388099.1 hypothetical protein [Novosphingobium sp.]QUM70738.1 hypothetical protein ICN83_09915 [Sphingopyxis granuli]
MSDVGGLFVASLDAATGIKAGKLRIVGSVVRHAAGPLKGKIHSYLQETGAAGALLESVSGAGSTFAKTSKTTGNPIAGAAVAGTQLASSLGGNVQNEIIRRGVNRVESKVDALASGMQTLKNLGVANLALSATGIGVSLVGFGIMNARLSRVEQTLAALTESTDRILAAVERIRQDQLASEFSALRSQVKLFEEAWLMSNQERATQVWLDVAQATRPHQDRFEGRARELLFAMPPEFDLADPIIDALALAGGLRVACLMACNESEAASSAASENARQIEGLTGTVGKVDLVMARIPSSIDRASLEWAGALAAAVDEAAPIAQRWRQREAIAATRAAPLAQLKHDGVTPREWLKAAREEQNEPILLLKAAE